VGGALARLAADRAAAAAAGAGARARRPAGPGEVSQASLWARDTPLLRSPDAPGPDSDGWLYTDAPFALEPQRL
jgi:hypothetical protein